MTFFWFCNGKRNYFWDLFRQKIDFWDFVFCIFFWAFCGKREKNEWCQKKHIYFEKKMWWTTNERSQKKRILCFLFFFFSLNKSFLWNRDLKKFWDKAPKFQDPSKNTPRGEVKQKMEINNKTFFCFTIVIFLTCVFLFLCW